MLLVLNTQPAARLPALHLLPLGPLSRLTNPPTSPPRFLVGHLSPHVLPTNVTKVQMQTAGDPMPLLSPGANWKRYHQLTRLPGLTSRLCVPSLLLLPRDRVLKAALMSLKVAISRSGKWISRPSEHKAKSKTARILSKELMSQLAR